MLKTSDNRIKFLFNSKKRQLFQESCYCRVNFYEKIFLFFISISILMIVTEENFFFEANFSVLIENKHSFSTNFMTNETESSYILRNINLLLMLILMIILFLRKKAHFFFLKSIQVIEFSKVFIISNNFLELCLEIFLIALQTYPGMLGWISNQQRKRNIIYLNDTIFTFMAVAIRVFFLVRSLLYLARFYSPKAIKICADTGVFVTTLFTIKSLFHLHLKLFTSIFLVLIILSNGILLRLCERSSEIYLNQDWDYIWNSIWCVVVTITNLGYGEILPITDNGRIIVGLTSLMGAFITSMICIIFFTEFSFSISQENAYERIKAVECTQKLNESASHCIGLAMKYSLRKKKVETSEDEDDLKDKFFVDIRKRVLDFRLWKKIIVDFKHYKPLERRLLFVNEDLNSHLDELGLLLTYYDFMKVRLDLIMKNQADLYRNLGLIENSFEIYMLQLIKFPETTLDNFKYLKKDQINSTFLKSEKYQNLSNLTSEKIPYLNLVALQDSFLTFTQKKTNTNKFFKNEKKMKEIANKIDNKLSCRTSRSSMSNRNSPTNSKKDIDKTDSINFEDEKFKKKRLSIFSKKGVKVNGKEKVTKRNNENCVKFANLHPEPLYKKEQYPSFDEISSPNFIVDSKIENKEKTIIELAEQEEKDDIEE